MKDLDQQRNTWSTDRNFGFKIRGEEFHGRLGLDYVLVAEYMESQNSLGSVWQQKFNELVEAFLGSDEFDRYEAWRLRQRDEGNPVTLLEAILITHEIIEEESARPTRASSDSSPGRATNGDGSTVASSSPATTEDQVASLSAVS